MHFRAARLQGRSRRTAAYGLLVIALVTFLSAWLPAYAPGAVGSAQAEQVVRFLPAGYLGVLAIALVSAAAAGGGRELLARDQAMAFPVSATTDHLGALLMAPLNIAWLTQSWLLLGATAYVVGPRPGLLLAQILVLVWLCAGTALAQAVAWLVEWLRRGPRGSWVVRLTVVIVAALGAISVGTASGPAVLGRLPTATVAQAALAGARGDGAWWLLAATTLGLVTALAVAVGAWTAERVARRPARVELRLEGAPRSPRRQPTSDLAALVRTDRLGVWRSVPLRRGFAVLVAMAGTVAVAGDLDWEMLTVLPGLVASGAALLFGVNAWCLDGRGALWRESLPVPPRLVFAARVIVLLEVLLLTTFVTLGLALVRVGPPTAPHLAAVSCSTLVVGLLVVSGSLRWSVRRPYAVDMRSARATPAPPLVMVGYSTRLAMSTTFVGLLFTLTAQTGRWQWSVVAALPLLAASGYRLVRTAREWATPETRSMVVSTVAS